jgi:hypothetical protein
MNEIIIEITIGVGLSVLLLLMIFHIVIFNKYKKIKLTEKPNFNYSQYQAKAGATYFIYPIPISEKDTNPNLIRLKKTYNRSITIWWVTMLVFLSVTLFLILISKLTNNT